MLIAIIIRFFFEKICWHLVARKLILPTGKGSCPLSYTTSFSVCTQVRVHGAVHARIGACTQYCVHVHAPIRARTALCARMHTLPFFISPCFLSLSLCTHLLSAAFQNRDEKNRMREDMNCNLVLKPKPKNKCIFAHKFIKN